jgi:tetratricopeptide (TPR) repeat protein
MPPEARVMFATLLFFAAVGGSTLPGGNDLAREIVLTRHVGAESEDDEIIRAQVEAGHAGGGAVAFQRLGWAYIAKARRTFDPGYYKLAEKSVDVVDRDFGASPESRLLRGHVLHNLHRFREAESAARQNVAERGLPVDFALLSDALIEQGKLEQGIAALQRMVDLRPGCEAMTRVAHVRWLKGDVRGAIAALESALSTTHRRDGETRAWILVRLSALYLQQGDANSALALAGWAGESISHYPPALFARGRALVALDRLVESIEPLQAAERLLPTPEYQWWLADALRSAGRMEEAAAVETRLTARGSDSDPRTLALFLATRRTQTAGALRMAKAELNQRQDVFTHDAFAWALFAANELLPARAAMSAALAAGTRDARLLLHAGEIALAMGETDEAERAFAEARRAAGTLTPSERAILTRRSQPPPEVAHN